jgi:uncharacterized repeat protein (TIGR03803 family)
MFAYKSAAAAVLICGGMVTPQALNAAKFKTIYTFKGGPDGSVPAAALTIGPDGNLYGTTDTGGQSNLGTLFNFDPTTTHETVLYSFRGGTDGAYSLAVPIFDKSGAIYGTTYEGGIATPCPADQSWNGCGTVFKFDPKTITESVVYRFTGVIDGWDPGGNLVIRNQILYGSTFGGYGPYLSTAFSLNPSTQQETLLYRFGSLDGDADGSSPSGMVADPAGNLYGAGGGGGTLGKGVIFKIDVATETESVLYNFAGGSDGAGPDGKLVLRANVLYGSTVQGGGVSNSGTIFKFDLRTNVETVLHRFAGEPNDGAVPTSGVVLSPGGLLFGTTSWGGNGMGVHGQMLGVGTAFRLNPLSGKEVVIHNFTVPSGASGAYPSGLVIDATGHLFGATAVGGVGCGSPSGCGTLFQITP